MCIEKEMLKFAIDKIKQSSQKIKSNLPHKAFDENYSDETLTNVQFWTNGFWPGILWLMYKHTGNNQFAVWANECEDKLDFPLHNYMLHHDVGFMYGLSSINNYTITGYEKSRIRALTAASLLAGRFNAAGEFIRAWNTEGTEGWAIIDCMMNLPLLYWASKELKDTRFSHIAVKHSDTTIKEFVREDGSVFHIVVFDPDTGKRIGQRDGQGYSEESSWGRGTSWALHGFALSYEHTGYQRYLDVAKKVASFFMDNLTDNYVAPSDFKAPLADGAKWDSTANSIAASGLVLLYRHTGEKYYRDCAIKLLEAVYTHCMAPKHYDSLLIHGNLAYHAAPPDDDLSLIYGDYYFLEALMRLEYNCI